MIKLIIKINENESTIYIKGKIIKRIHNQQKGNKYETRIITIDDQVIIQFKRKLNNSTINQLIVTIEN